MTISGLLARIQGILNSIVPFIIGLAVFVIIWGIFKYILHAAEEEKRAEARAYIIWGIVGVFFMLSIWGFVNILVNTFDLERTISGDKIPKVPPITGGTTGGGGDGVYDNMDRPDAGLDLDNDGILDINQ